MQRLRKAVNFITVLDSGQVKNNCYKNTACKDKEF